MKITALARPFVLSFHATGTAYLITSEEAQRLLDEYPAISATRNRVVLPGHNTSDPKQRVVITPATRGGGPSFTVERDTLCPKCKAISYREPDQQCASCEDGI